MSAPRPIVMLGVHGTMGAKASQKLLPEYEAIQFITSVERAKKEIPIMQAGDAPPKDPDNVGSHDFSKLPEAVVIGRGFNSEQVEEIRQACGGASSGLVWLKSVDEKQKAISGQPPDFSKPEVLEAYSGSVAGAVKTALASVKWGTDGVYEYE